MAMTEQARLAQKTKRAAKKPAKPAIVRTVAVLRDELPPKFLRALLRIKLRHGWRNAPNF